MTDAIDVFDVNENAQESQLIPEGKQKLYVLSVEVSKPLKSKNAKTLKGAYFKAVTVKLYHKETDRIIDLRFTYSRTNKKNYLKFVNATGVEKIDLGDGKFTYIPENKCTESPAGAVGAMVEAVIVHQEKKKVVPLTDESGNRILGDNGKPIWQEVTDQEGNPVMVKYETIAKDEDNSYAIYKPEEKYEPFFYDENEIEEESTGGVDDFFV
jgi:hypothetical protein